MFEWLNDYKYLQQQIRYYEFRIRQSKTELKRWEMGSLQNVTLTKGSIAEGIINGEYVKRDEDELSRLKELRDNLINFIDSFEDLNSKILKLKYIDNISLYEVSEVLGYSYGYIKTRHASLMQVIKSYDEYLLD